MLILHKDVCGGRFSWFSHFFREYAGQRPHHMKENKTAVASVSEAVNAFVRRSNVGTERPADRSVNVAPRVVQFSSMNRRTFVHLEKSQQPFVVSKNHDHPTPLPPPEVAEWAEDQGDSTTGCTQSLPGCFWKHSEQFESETSVQLFSVYMNGS